MNKIAWMFWLLGWSLGPFAAYAQNQPMSMARSNTALAFGIKDALAIDQLMVTVPGFGTTGLELTSSQNLKPLMMPVRKTENPGRELFYNLAGCLEYYYNIGRNYKMNFSPDFIALSLRDQNLALNAPNAFRFLADVGTIHSADLPYGATSLERRAPSASRFRITNYLHLIQESTKPKQKIFELRKALLRGNPVLIEMRADDSLPRALGVDTWSLQAAANEVYPLVVVGFDEEKQAVELMSAWGNQWGRGGYLWIDYEPFSELVLNGYVLVPQGY